MRKIMFVFCLIVSFVRPILAETMEVQKDSYDYIGDDTDGWWFIRKLPNAIGWGSGSATNVTVAYTNISQVSAGYDHCIALTSNQALVGWGSDTHSQLDVPIGLDQSQVSNVLAGKYWSAALMNDGSVTYWGTFGTGLYTSGVSISNTSPFTQIVASHTNEIFGLCADGTVISFDETGNTTYPNISNAVYVAGNSLGHKGVVLSNGTITNWGGNATNVATRATNVTMIAMGDKTNHVLRVDGTIFSWNPTNTILTGGTVSSLTNNIFICAYTTNAYSLHLNPNTGTYCATNVQGNIPIPISETAITLKQMSFGNAFGIGVK